MNASGTGSCLKKADWFSIVGVTVRREGAGLQPVQSVQSQPQTCALRQQPGGGSGGNCATFRERTAPRWRPGFSSHLIKTVIHFSFSLVIQTAKVRMVCPFTAFTWRLRFHLTLLPSASELSCKKANLLGVTSYGMAAAIPVRPPLVGVVQENNSESDRTDE